MAVCMGGTVSYGPHISKKYQHDDLLREFRLDVQSFSVRLTGEADSSYGTTATMSYEVDKIRNYQNYGFVQYIRGCIFDSTEIDGKIEYRTNVSRTFFGETISFKHKTWQIDSIDIDPMYANITDDWIGKVPFDNRHARYNWADNGDFIEDWDHKIGSSGAGSTRIFRTDRPGTAFLSGVNARNLSLEFSTCIHHNW